MSNDEKPTEEAQTAQEPPTEDDVAVAAETTPEQAVEAKLELMVNIAMLTIFTLLRLIREKGAAAIGEAELEQFNKVKESVQMAVDAVEEWSRDNDSEESPIDLTRVRAKLDQLIKKIDQWPLDATTIDSTPPS